jgi:RHS repeat-associated protein
MARSPYRQGSGRIFSRILLRVAALATVAAWCMVIWTPDALAAQVIHGGGLPGVKMFGYASGPAQHRGTAAGKAHYVPASATRAAPALARERGRRAPKPNLAPAPMGTPALVRTRSARMPAGHEVVGHRVVRTKPSALSAAARPAAALAGSPTDNASYSVAATFDTVPMADQTGRIAVTLTNTGTSTWGSGYALGTQVFSSSNTTGTGTPLSTGASVPVTGSVAPGGAATVESVTPAENPGSYTICWDMVNAAGTYFSAEGGAEHCAAYTIQQFAPVINEQEPLPGTDVDSQTPALSASATVPGGFPVNPTFSYAFEILNGPSSTATVLQSSGWVAGNSNSWTPPTALAWGGTYYWRATVSDLATPPSLTVPSLITWTTSISFVVGDAQPGVLATLGNAYHASDGNPIMTSDLGGSDYSGSGKTVDPQTGNVSQKVTDAGVATPGPALSIVRTYNSLDPRTSQGFGAGWSSMLDMSLVPDGDGSGALILTMADGRQVRFAKNAAGGYAAPQDMYAVVTALTGGGFSVTDQTGTTYDFAQARGTSWLISQIIDNTGKAESFTYGSGMLAAITSTTSGRALHLTWATPAGATSPHVATVATDPVTVGQPGTPLTWTYGYNGDLLTSVCPAGTPTACTAYGYTTGGSHAATSVRNADPTSYYRLNDPASATAAANQVPVDDLTTMDPPATEMNTTPGVPGPISGVTATGFNGTSSWIPLDGTWCPTPNLASACLELDSDTGRVVTSAGEAFSVWFKTTSASGILLGAGSGEPTVSCVGDIECNEVPLLWIGSNGHLEGLRTVTMQTGTSTTPDIYASAALSSPAAVNNGAWHQAVLVPGQALYLDGTKVATGTSATTLPASDYDVLLGAGQSPGSLCASCQLGSATWQYFNGSMADLSIYQNQLPSSGTVAAQYAAETHAAAELTTITSPAGHTELSAAYDTVNDRVATLTDANGGTWTYGGAVRGSSSGAYDSAVMGSSPEDFWPLNDTAGPLARDTVASAATAAVPRPPATYSNVTLGAAGPTGFPDGTAATFNGTSSQVTVPGGYFGGTGAETAELWFKTTKTGTLLSSGAGPTGGEPLAIWIPKGADCLEGSVGSTVLNNALFGLCVSTAINDGKWHQAAITLSPGTTTSGAFSQTATLYQDGVVLATAQITKQATASAAGYVADIGSGTNGFLNGSVADVSLYPSELTSGQVATHFAALQDQVSIPGAINPLTGQPVPSVTLPTLNTQTITVTDPVGKNALYIYASGALVRTSDALGGVTSYGYDEARRATTITDPDGDTTYMTYDAHNNVTSTTMCAAINDCQTTYASYFEDLPNPLDPRNDKPTDSRDPRSTSPSDPAYDTVTAYTATGQIAATTTPARSACPSGCATTNAYTAGTEAAIGGGTEPAGLVASVTAPGGGVTRYAYDSSGNLMQITDPLGLVTKYTYDNLGRQLTQTQISDTYPAGLTTSYTYDGLDRIVTVTAPPVTDRVTGAVHTKVTSYAYDPDSDVLATTISDATGGDPSRATPDTYNSHGELASTTDPLGNATSYTYDALGDKLTETTPAGVTTAYTYDAAGDLLTTTLDGYTGNPSDPSPAASLVEESRAYDPAGRLASVTDVRGTTTAYTYYGDNSLASSYVVDPGSSTGKDDLTTYGYDAAGNAVTETSPGALVSGTTYNADDQATSQTEDPAGTDRTTTASYDRAGDVISESLTGGGVTQTVTSTYGLTGAQLSQTVDNSGGNLTTGYARDQRGLVISETDPEGNTTYIQNDEAGRPVVQTSPAVPSQTNGGAPVTGNPVTMTGYDTFGDPAESSDADGNVSTLTYDQDGRQLSVTNPAPPRSSTPVGTATTTYNSVGEETSSTDPLGNTTQKGYDQLGDLTSQVDPGGGTWTYTYDPAGEQTSVTDPTGAQTQSTYDNLGQRITSTDLVRQNAAAAYTTNYGYDAAGDLKSQTSPTGVTTSSTYDALGEMTSSTDGAGNAATYSYDLDGNLAKVTAPDGTAVVAAYDLAGRQTSQSDLSAAGAVQRTESLGYDADGAVTSTTNFLGNTSTATYDATGMLTSQTQPVSASKSITVSYGYDLDGHETAATDGNGNITYATYNSLGLPQSIIEPPAGASTSAADSTTTDTYDANGDLVTQDLPGGVQTTKTYDAMGDLTGQSGTGASAPTAPRAFTYDAAGRMLTAVTGAAGTQGTFGYQPATSESFSYDDRGMLLAASGSAGNSVFTYNASGQVKSANEAAGTSTYTYDSAGRLAADADAASGTTGTYSYNSLDQVSQISYGTGNDSQSFGYDTLHRLTSDTVATASGAQVAAISYGYDAAADVTSMTTSGLATAGGGSGTVTNTYGYDQADRLTSWTATPAGGSATTKTYGYDNNGNLTSSNGVTYSYDARNELTSDSSGNSSTYTADGDLASQTGASASAAFTSDAYGQQVTDGASAYAWDALGRVMSVGNQHNSSDTIALTYDGMSSQVTSDSSATYSRDPAGAIVGVDAIGGSQTIALNDQHDDLSGTFTAAGTILAGSASYDPWGQVLATSGPAIQVGYQGQWTDPATQQVAMGARFYGPAQGGFGDQDTYTGGGNGPAGSGDLHAYADDNPMSVTDPTGHSPAAQASAGTVTQGQVQAARARAAQAEQVASRDEARARAASAAATHAESTATAAVANAIRLNHESVALLQRANDASQAADQAYQDVKADQATEQSLADRIRSTELTLGVIEATYGIWGRVAAYDIRHLVLDPLEAQFADQQSKTARDEAIAAMLQKKANAMWNEYYDVAFLAHEANMTALADGALAGQAERTAKYLVKVAAGAENIAAEDEAYYQKLLKEYQSESHKAANSCDLACRIKNEAKKLAKALLVAAAAAILAHFAAVVAAAASAAATIGSAIAAGAAAAGAAIGAAIAAVGSAAADSGPVTGASPPSEVNKPPLGRAAIIGINIAIGAVSNFVGDLLHGKRGWVLVGDTAIGGLTGTLGGVFEGGAALVGGAAAGFFNSVITQLFDNEGHPDSVNGWQVLLDTGFGIGFAEVASLIERAGASLFRQIAFSNLGSFVSSICDPSNIWERTGWCWHNI